MNSLLIRELGAIAQIRVVLGATLEDPNRSSNLPNEPLVNQSWQSFTHIAAIVFAIGLIAIVGIVSKKVEHAVAAALVSSLLLIGFFFLVGR